MSRETMDAMMSDSKSQVKRIIVLASQDHAEAMRVAAGLTIFGHHVELVFVDRVVEETPESIEHAELLAQCGVEPVSMVEDRNIDQIDRSQLVKRLQRCQHVINI
ncbi:MAG: hypothetical protein ACI9PZ_002381 [Parvicella sp.]|jgi:hypothetical protein